MTFRTGYIALLAAALLLVLTGVAASEPTTREYPYLYKSPRALGMGGAYVAIGGRVDSLFYNPAGLAKMPEKNWEVNLINIGMESENDVTNFINDVTDATDIGDLNGNGDESDDQLNAVLDVLAKHRGRNLHLRVSDFTSIGRNGEKIGFGFGALVGVKVDAMTHQGFGSNGVLELNGDATYGGVGGMSYKLRDNIFLGAGLKLLHRESLTHNFTAREIVEKQDDLGDYIVEDLRKSGNGLGLDVGGIYQFAQESWFKPAVGLSVMNLGKLNFKDAGEIPMTVNLGVSMNPDRIPLFKSLIVGFDYVDVFKGYDQDSDTAKRLRFGGELQVFDWRLASAALRAGLYQGYGTFGADLRLLIFDFSYTTYAEEVGAYAGQDGDRRHLLALNIGW